MMKNRLARQGTFIVAAHAVVLFLHSAAHLRLGILLSWAGNLYVATVIVVAPILAAVLLWTRFRRTAALLLAASMAGAFAFGVYAHFVADSPDHVRYVSATGWGFLFKATAVAMAGLEAWGSGVGIVGLIQRPAKTPSGS